MILPELAWQWVYARLAWGVVSAALVDRALPASMVLPGAASPAYWFGLVFQLPSVLLVACSAVAFAQGVARSPPAVDRQGGEPLRAPVFALSLAVLGALLYADTTGWLHLEVYARGVDPVVAPALAIVLAVFALWLVVRASGAARVSAWCLLASVTLFSATRLPTGNVFDALLDPLLWCWAVGASVTTAARALRRRGEVRATR